MPLVGGVYTAWAGDGRRRASCFARDRRRHLPAAADAADGRDAAGDRALGRRRRPTACRGSASSTAATSPAPCSAACSPASTCCACTTSRSRPTSRVALNVAVALHRARRSRGRTTYAARRRSTVRGADARRGAVVGLRRDRAVGHDRAGGRSDLDAAAVAALRRHGLHLLADPRGVPVGLGIGSSVGSALARDVARPRVGARLVPAAAVRRDGVGGLHAHRVAAVLADQSVARDDAVVHVPARSRALPVGRAAGRDPVGRELSAGAGGGRDARSRIPAGWSAASTPPTRSARSSARWREPGARRRGSAPARRSRC